MSRTEDIPLKKLGTENNAVVLVMVPTPFLKFSSPNLMRSEHYYAIKYYHRFDNEANCSCIIIWQSYDKNIEKGREATTPGLPLDKVIKIRNLVCPAT
jgi:hypothetical protein